MDLTTDKALAPVIERADMLLSPAYRPLAAPLIERVVTPLEARYRLRYRSWDLLVSFQAVGWPRARIVFTCRLVGSGVLAALHDALPGVRPGSTLVGPVSLGSERFAGPVEAMGEVYARVVHRPDVQRRIRRGEPWPPNEGVPQVFP